MVNKSFKSERCGMIEGVALKGMPMEFVCSISRLAALADQFYS